MDVQKRPAHCANCTFSGIAWRGKACFCFFSQPALSKWLRRRRHRRREETLMTAKKFSRCAFPRYFKNEDQPSEVFCQETSVLTCIPSNQAVLVADSFKRRMSPITYSTPKCLLPVVNIPLINYALEAIISAGLPSLSRTRCLSGHCFHSDASKIIISFFLKWK